MGMVFAGTGTVWEISTRGILVPNPTNREIFVFYCTQSNTDRQSHGWSHAKNIVTNFIIYLFYAFLLLFTL